MCQKRKKTKSSFSIAFLSELDDWNKLACQHCCNIPEFQPCIYKDLHGVRMEFRSDCVGMICEVTFIDHLATRCIVGRTNTTRNPMSNKSTFNV